MTTLRTHLKLTKGLFYSLGSGHAVVASDMGPGTFEVGAELQLHSMMQMFELNRDGARVGFWFYSGFTVENKGGFLVSYLASKKGKAKSAKVILRHPEVMVFDVPGCGVMAVTPDINPRLADIIQGQ
jgi:hypothetical protein